MTRTTPRLLLAALTSASLLTVAVPVLAQDETPPTTISAIDRGEATGDVYLEGAALERLDDDEYLFSDGSGVIEPPMNSVSLTQKDWALLFTTKGDYRVDLVRSDFRH